jgi:TRAP-type C4-dicarboxylate transport system substrate-binding protein
MKTHLTARWASWGGALALGLAIGSGMASPAAAQTKWNLPAAYPLDNYHSENLVFFSKEIEKETGGKLLVTVHPGASLFKAPEIKRAVATGQAQMGEVLISIHENEDPIFGLDTIPFLASSYADVKKLNDARRAAIAAKLDSQGIKLLYLVPWGPQGLYAKKDINTVADLKGLKMRAYNVGTTRIAELAGAQPVTIQAAELPQALATGTITAFMTSGSTGYDSKVWETMTHYYDLQAWIPANVTFVNKAAFAGLDKAAQDAVLKAAAAAEARGWKLAEEKATWYVDQLKAKGMKVVVPSPELKAGLKKIGEQLTADWIAKAGPPGKAVVDAYLK